MDVLANRAIWRDACLDISGQKLLCFQLPLCHSSVGSTRWWLEAQSQLNTGKVSLSSLPCPPPNLTASCPLWLSVAVNSKPAHFLGRPIACKGIYLNRSCNCTQMFRFRGIIGKYVYIYINMPAFDNLLTFQTVKQWIKSQLTAESVRQPSGIDKWPYRWAHHRRTLTSNTCSTVIASSVGAIWPGYRSVWRWTMTERQKERRPDSIEQDV